MDSAQISATKEKLKVITDKFSELRADSDSIIVFGHMPEEKVKNLIGNACNFEEYRIY
jgi:hypothetical protein